MRKERILITLAAIVFVIAQPNNARGQSAFTGVAKDATGSVIPGVTVEAVSPALIEGMRTVVSRQL